MSAVITCPDCKRQAVFGFRSDLSKTLYICQYCEYTCDAVLQPFNPEPTHLYKYRGHDLHSRSWITNEEIYLSDPLRFNDPFDSQVVFNYDGDREKRRRFYSRLVGFSEPHLKKREAAKRVTEWMATGDSNLENCEARKWLEAAAGNVGVVCLSTVCDDLLMFGYYANNHQGYCLKYRRTSDSVFRGAQQVQYADSYPRFSYYDLDPNLSGDFVQTMLFTKSKHWGHEQEWRLSISKKAKRCLKLPCGSLEGIILGCAMPETIRGEIIALNNARTKPLQIFHAVKREFKFGLDIVPL